MAWSPTDTPVYAGSLHFAKHCIEHLPSGVSQLLLFLETLLVGVRGKFDPLHRRAKGTHMQQALP